MSKITQLIAKKCPDGVRYKALGEVCEVGKKESITKSKLLEHGQFPVINSSREVLGYLDKSNNSGNTLVLTSHGAYAGFCHFMDTDFFAGSLCYPMKSVDENAILTKFIYYWLKNIEDTIRELYTNKSGVPYINFRALMRSKIPVPPRDVQEEIVKMLDSFTRYETALRAELQARIKQYEYCRDKLMSEEGQVEWRALGEVCETVTDYVAAGSFAELAKKVKYITSPDYAMLIRTMDLKNNFTSKNLIYISESAYNYLWRVKLDGEESIILPNIGNCGEVYYLRDDFPYAHCALATNAILVRSTAVSNRFLFYYFQSKNFQKRLKKIISPVGQTKFNKTDLKKILLPIPTRAVQERVVGILDGFDQLCYSLKFGLPAEIATRRRQYEYYRNKLLSMKESE